MITEYGKVIRLVERDVLDSFSSAWSDNEAAPGDYLAYAMDGSDPLAFWLHPMPAEDHNVIVTFAGVPPVLASVENNITVSDMYMVDLVDYLVHRALSKDARAGAKMLGEQYREAFLMRLGAGRQIMRQIGQNASRPPDAEA